MNGAEARRRAGPAGESQTAGAVFRAFFQLGLTSFGGPVAHLGYFREAFVVRRRWIDDQAYADLVALCQFLPGPASSQVGIGIGLARAGLPGAFAAWVAFTTPSALLLAALYNPVWTSGILTPADFALALAAFTLLVFWKVPPWLVVVLSAAGGWGIQVLASV